MCIEDITVLCEMFIYLELKSFTPFTIKSVKYEIFTRVFSSWLEAEQAETQNVDPNANNRTNTNKQI